MSLTDFFRGSRVFVFVVYVRPWCNISLYELFSPFNLSYYRDASERSEIREAFLAKLREKGGDYLCSFRIF